MKDKVIIDQISKSYLLSKSIIREDELGVCLRKRESLDAYMLIVRRIETVVDCLSEDDRFIIKNEVILGKKGEWYSGYMSTPTYYRHRRIAYSNFLYCLNS